MKNGIKIIFTVLGLWTLIRLFEIIKDIKIKDIKISMRKINFWDTAIGWSIKIWTVITLFIPIMASFCLIIFSILGIEHISEFFRIWSDWFVTGSFLEIAAWRWQIILFIFITLFTITQKD